MSGHMSIKTRGDKRATKGDKRRPSVVNGMKDESEGKMVDQY